MDCCKFEELIGGYIYPTEEVSLVVNLKEYAVDISFNPISLVKIVFMLLKN